MEVVRRFCESRRLPVALAFAALILMLPALPIGLFGDDLLQRPIQFPPSALPPTILQTGLVPDNPGKIRTVMENQFGYIRDSQSLRQAKEYGLVPWWASDDLRIYLWRPATAFTHWLDYQLWPRRPVLMHAQNILWFAGAVFLTATLYRRVAGPNSLMTAGLAGVLYLLDKDTFAPVAYVANRGFFISLVFGLLCWHAHVRWRTAKAQRWMWVSAACFGLSLLANEGGASTLAFLMAYALVIEPQLGPQTGKSPDIAPTALRCALSLLPAVMALACWRVVYSAGGFGVRHLTGYIDPAYAPLPFVRHLAARLCQTLGGQLSGVPPELTLALNERWQTIACLFFAAVSVSCALLFLPVIRKDRTARFWAVTTLFALIPASTVVPLSKNLVFVAVGAFGVMAAFLVHVARAVKNVIPRIAAILLLTIHVAGALVARAAISIGCHHAATIATLAQDYAPNTDVGGKDIVLINDPTSLSVIVPFYRAYRGEPLPRGTHILVPGSVPMSVKRTDESTLVVSATEGDLFGCRDLGPIHLAYAAKTANDLFFARGVLPVGQRVVGAGFEAEILAASARGAPRSIAFHFAEPLESTNCSWLIFDWRYWAHEPFALPALGQSVDIAGPRGSGDN